MALDAIYRITIDVADQLVTPVVKAVSEDIRSRYVDIVLVQNGDPIEIPAGTLGVIGIRRPTGTYVLYDEDEDGDPAVTFDGNVATCYLRQEALAVPGRMYTSLTLYKNSTALSAFHFLIDVEARAVPDDAVVESDYFNILQGLIEDALDAAERAEDAAASLSPASTSHAGIVQLYDGIDSTSVSMAPTANAMRMVEPVKKAFANTTVSSSDFVADATYANFPYRAAVALTGVTASMIPEVIFDAEDAVSGAFAPIATAYSGGVYIYSVAPESITIPTIIVWRGV